MLHCVFMEHYREPSGIECMHDLMSLQLSRRFTGIFDGAVLLKPI